MKKPKKIKKEKPAKEEPKIVENPPEMTQELMEEEDEYDELVQDLTSWLDSFVDIDLNLPPINFMVFITCLIGQLRWRCVQNVIIRIGNILKSVINIFNQKNFRVLSPRSVTNKFFLSNKDVLKTISNVDKNDIAKSKKILNDLSKYDNAQSVISVNGYLIAIEAAEGTDDLLKRAAKVRERLDQLKIKSGVLTKIPKKNQSTLVDLPVIGPQTIRLVKKANLNGLAIKQKFTMVENKRKTIELIKKFNLRLYNLGW